MKFGYKCLLLCAVVAASSAARAQEHTPQRPRQEWMTRGRDAYSQQFYNVAALDARQYIASQTVAGASQPWLHDDLAAQYFRVAAQLKAGQADSALQLMRSTTDMALHDRLALGVARAYFLRGALQEAIPFYKEAGIANLTNTEIADSKFELAYCLFNSSQFDQAEPLFAIIREVPGKYYSAGNYYYGLLAYNRGQYADALRSFDRINNEPAYRSTVPYYMAELEYYLGNREKALKDALRLIKRPEKLYYDNELHLLVAQCLFEGDRFGEALPYFEYYYQHSDKIRKEELYEMAYAYYRVSEWQHAIEGFRQLSTAKDSLGQTSMYLLGDCYLKTGDKASARNAFGICSGMSFNPGQRESALLLYAQLSQVQGFTADALRSANALLSDYPATASRNEAYDVLARVYASTRNYAEAYRSLHQMTARPAGIEKLIQPVAYGYALQQLQNGNTGAADSLLSESLAQNAVPAYTAAGAFWKAEVAGREHRSSEAIHYAQVYLDNSKSTANLSPEATPAAAYSIMGYAALDAKDYGSAQQYFRKSGDGGNSDVLIREADALFMQKNFAAAAPLYAKAAAAGSSGDYARLQQAIIAGLKGKREEKVRLLQSILSSVPPSAYAADARYELGAAQIEGGNYTAAVETLTPLTQNATFASRALLKIGAANNLAGNAERSEAAYTAIIKRYAGSPEYSDALAALKSSYINRNNPDGFAALMTENGISADSTNDLEGTYYSAAEGQYAAQDWKGAESAFQKYLVQFPVGGKGVKAHYYLGESQYQQKKYADALVNYTAVYQQPWADFSESAAQRVAELSYQNKAWSDAIAAYKSVREHTIDSNIARSAMTGLMRSAAQMSAATTDSAGTSARYEALRAAGAYADTLSGFGGLSPALKEETHLYQARAAMAGSDYAAADAIFIPLQYSKNDAVAAEARYYHGAALLNGGKLKEAEEAAGKNIKKGGGGDYWVVKSYILLGDILAAKKDYFNARATLQSVAEHSSIESLKAEAKRKLDALPAAEGSKISND